MISDGSLTKKQARAALTGLRRAALECLREDGRFVLPGVAVVRARTMPPSPARTGRNPATGEPMEIPAMGERPRITCTVSVPLKVDLKAMGVLKRDPTRPRKGAVKGG